MPAVRRPFSSVLGASRVLGAVVGAVVAGACFNSVSIADTTVPPGLSMSVTSNGETVAFNPSDYGNSWAHGNGTFGFGGNTSSPGAWTLGWSLLVNPDPFIIANLVVTNTSAMTSLFVLSVTLPIGMPLPFGTLIGGSVTGSVTDMNGDGATLSSPAGGSIYTALLDGVPVATLLDSPLSVTTGAFESNVVGPAVFGDPIPNDIGPPVAATMTIELQFLLSPGDAAAFTSIFVVVDIPAPAALALFPALAVFAGQGCRRRRRR